MPNGTSFCMSSFFLNQLLKDDLSLMCVDTYEDLKQSVSTIEREPESVPETIQQHPKTTTPNNNIDRIYAKSNGRTRNVVGVFEYDPRSFDKLRGASTTFYRQEKQVEG